MSTDILSAHNLSKTFRVRRGARRGSDGVRAVDSIDLTIGAAETVGLVGESGCGKTTVSRLLLMLERPTSGSIAFKGQPTTALTRDQLREFRREVQPVFQNPFSSLNPRMRVGAIVSEPLQVSSSHTRGEIATRVADALDAVGLDSRDADKYPHEFSGGQRQRIAIARALASNPRLIILDEAVSSQDISIRAQILNLLKDLQERHRLSYLFVAHDLATVRYMSDRISVMYLGRVVESATAEQLYEDPRHPYTQALLAACLPDGPDQMQDQPPITGEPPSPLAPPTGCHFHPRCPHATPACTMAAPPMREVSPRHWVACVLYQQRAAS